ncbi:WhiB family transcriptional regulator [Streptomyces cinereoruber]|uniref:WhiB family transcriptional regulator n=1 Tax=Streptomyces cinereoruber TaxID=67260 RepID=UPI00362B4FD2
MSDMRTRWRTYAACLEVHPDDMFPDPRNQAGNRRAKQVCRRCPVWQLCLNDALTEEGGKRQENRHGIRGGLTSDERYLLHHRTRVQGQKAAV